MNEGFKDADSDYSLAGLAHHVVKAYNPQFFARGTESLVYVPKREGRNYAPTIFKVNINSLRLCATWLSKNQEATLDDYIHTTKDGHDYVVKAMLKSHKEATQYFGAEQVPAQRVFVAKLPITPAILSNIKLPNIALKYRYNEILAIVTAQIIYKDVGMSDSPNIHAGHLLETNEMLPEKVMDVDYDFVFKPLPNKSVDSDVVKEILYTEGIKKLIKLAEDDKLVADAVSRFISSAMRYSMDTDKILDFVGSNNVTLVYKDIPHLIITDGISPNEMKPMFEAPIILANLLGGSTTSDLEDHILRSTIIYIRTINALASILGIEERLDIFSNIKGLMVETQSARLLKELYKSYSVADVMRMF